MRNVKTKDGLDYEVWKPQVLHMYIELPYFYKYFIFCIKGLVTLLALENLISFC